MARLWRATTLVVLAFAVVPAAGATPRVASAPALTFGSTPSFSIERLGGAEGLTALVVSLGTSTSAPLPSRIATYVPAGYTIKSELPTGSVLGLAALFESG